jgi:hypothetical protein
MTIEVCHIDRRHHTTGFICFFTRRYGFVALFKPFGDVLGDKPVLTRKKIAIFCSEILKFGASYEFSTNVRVI